MKFSMSSSPPPNKVSIIIPCYNEKGTILEIIRRVVETALPIEKEILIVDDGSTDGSRELLQKINNCQVYFHDHNLGKGAAIKTALAHASGDIFLIQDADLEYHPKDFQRLLEPILHDHAQVVYGSRELGHNQKHSGWFFYSGALFITWLTNLLFGAHLTDEATGYKVFTREVLNKINLSAQGFDFCPEITAKILKLGIPIIEIPISYQPRLKKQGKKIKFRDGWLAVCVLLREKMS